MLKSTLLVKQVQAKHYGADFREKTRMGNTKTETLPEEAAWYVKQYRESSQESHAKRQNSRKRNRLPFDVHLWTDYGALQNAP